MPAEHSIKGHWALITGASSGLGADFARELAARGSNLVLVARRQERLQQLRAEIESGFGVNVQVMAEDLLDPLAPRRLHAAVRAQGLTVDLLINNAGIGYFGNVLDVAWEKDRDTLFLNVVALVELSRLFGKDMAARGFGRILQIASTGAYQPDPSMACYGASKAFVLSFGEALACELAGTGVTATVLSPGYTDTEFHQAGGQPLTWLKRSLMMRSRKVAAIGVRAMLSGRRSVVAGWANVLMTFSMRFVPRRLAAWMARRVLDPRR